MQSRYSQQNPADRLQPDRRTGEDIVAAYFANRAEGILDLDKIINRYKIDMTRMDTFAANIRPVDVSQIVESAASANMQRMPQVDITSTFEPISYKEMYNHMRAITI